METDKILEAIGAANEFSTKYLAKMGWFKSLSGLPCDHDGVVPWITYPAFRQLKRLIRPEFKVFEFGSGASSIWWANNVARVVSVENDVGWAAKIMKVAPDNLTVNIRTINAPVAPEHAEILERFFDDNPDLPTCDNRRLDIAHGFLCREFFGYVGELLKYPAGTFDVIYVDGMARSLTAWLAGKYLKPNGFILFDNSDRWQYNAGYRALKRQGFSRLDYYGPGPVHGHEWCSSIFTRTLEPFADCVDSPPNDNDLGW